MVPGTGNKSVRISTPVRDKPYDLYSQRQRLIMIKGVHITIVRADTIMTRF